MVIDAHQHFWKTAAQEQPWRGPDHRILERDFDVDDLVPELDRAGIDGTVLVQSVDEPAENLRLARYAASDRVAGVVAWLPLRDPRSARRELAGLKIPKLVGVRCLIADDPLDWLADPEPLGLFGELADHGLSWDVVPITREQIGAVIKLAEAVPGLRMIIDHLGRPPLETAGWQPWAGQLAELAACPNVAIKLSVGIDALTAWSGWNPSTIERYADHALDLFGPDRVMVASNWPVVELRAGYHTAWTDLSRLALRDRHDPEERRAVLGGSAQRWYRLPTVSGAATRQGVTAPTP
ncbi:L-fuconolactonase [Microlunatus soli]|uniref:L-fuconolactonase n=2 Tax=Microlunatus soli TaxID=630515 RepID=A0A1H1ZPF6_9ACTN|nr:L-fuconolactonase [Microlunatus soli]